MPGWRLHDQTLPFQLLQDEPEIIRLEVMLCIRFPLSLRNAEHLLLERGIGISHETVRDCWNRCGPMFASEVKGKRVAAMRACRRWRWHLDEIFAKINGVTHCLWPAVDQDGEVPERIVTNPRDRKAALTLLKKSMKRLKKSMKWHSRPEPIVTDRLRFCGGALKDLGRGDRRAMGRWLDNRAEDSLLPF